MRILASICIIVFSRQSLGTRSDLSSQLGLDILARHALLAYRHAAAGQRAHRKAEGGNSTNQGREPFIFARWQEETRCSIGSRTSTSAIAGNSGRTGFTYRLEKDINNSFSPRGLHALEIKRKNVGTRNKKEELSARGLFLPRDFRQEPARRWQLLEHTRERWPAGTALLARTTVKSALRGIRRVLRSP